MRNVGLVKKIPSNHWNEQNNSSSESSEYDSDVGNNSEEPAVPPSAVDIIDQGSQNPVTNQADTVTILQRQVFTRSTRRVNPPRWLGDYETHSP